MCGFLCCCVVWAVFLNHVFSSPGVKVWRSSGREDTKSVCSALEKNKICNPKYVLKIEYTVCG